MNKPLCPYCGARSMLVDSAEVYRRSYGPIYLCRPCQAWVGVHKGTTNPLGRLANAELRTWKMRAHAAFDPHWRGEKRKRGLAYGALAKALNIHRPDCHIGMFDLDACQRVVMACEYGLVVDLMEAELTTSHPTAKEPQ